MLLAGCALPHARARSSDDAAASDASATIDGSDVLDDRAAMDTVDASAPDALPDALADALPDALPDSAPDSAPDARPDAGPPVIAVYSELNGELRYVADRGAQLTGGPLAGGTTASAFTSLTYLGAMDSRFCVLDSSGRVQRYFIPASNTDTARYEGADLRSTLTNGPLASSEVRLVAPGVPQYIGVTSGYFVYTSAGMGSSGNRVSVYGVYGNHDFIGTWNWSNFSGGSLDRTELARGVGLRDFAGHTDISDTFIMNVEPDGTLEYYSVVTGNHQPGLDPSFGSWTTLRRGPLEGLELTMIQRSAAGTFGSYRYRYLGNSDDNCVFELTPL